MRVLLAVFMVAGLTHCGGGEEPGRPAPPPAPPLPPATAKAPTAPPVAKGPTVPPNRIGVYCLARWESGPSAAFQCFGFGPDKEKAQISKETLVLDRICVNDTRLTKFTVNGQETAFVPTGDQPLPCATLAAVKGVPETCRCAPPAGGACDSPPKGGFVCVATGTVPRPGTPG